MKAPRFMTEYANFQRRKFKENELMQDDIKKEALSRIDRIMSLYERGIVTVDETMERICHPLSSL